MSKSKEAQAWKIILDYLNRQNRPYSAVDVFNNLHKEIGKTAVVKTLETLAAEGKIKEKLNGKQKVYFPDQEQFPSVDDAELKKMDDTIQKLSETLKLTESTCRQLESALSQVSSSLTTEEAQKKLAETKLKCSQLTQKLHQLKSNSNAVSPEERQKILKMREKYVKEWRKRKRMANDMFDAILEGYPKSKKEFFEDVGIETDEEYKVKPPEL